MLRESPGDHIVTFCRTDTEVSDTAAEYLLASVQRGGVAVAIATPGQIRHIDQRFADAGIDPVATRAGGDYVVRDALTTLEQFSSNGWPDPAAFWRTVSPIISPAAQVGGREVTVFGGVVSLLWQRGQFAAAVELEALWNELARQHHFGLLCAYLGVNGTGQEVGDELAMVLSAHTRETAPSRPRQPGRR